MPPCSPEGRHGHSWPGALSNLPGASIALDTHILLLQHDAGDVEDAVGLVNAFQRVVGRRAVQGENHQRLAARLSLFAASDAGHRADVHMRDVDARLAQNRAHLANHAWAVQVAREEDVTAGYEIGGV